MTGYLISALLVLGLAYSSFVLVAALLNAHDNGMERLRRDAMRRHPSGKR